MQELKVGGRWFRAASEIVTRLNELDNQYSGRHFPDSAAKEWDQLNEAVESLNELDKRQVRLGEMYRSGQVENVADTFNRSNPIGRAFNGQGRDAGLRTIEQYVRSGELRSDAADRLDDVLKRDDPTIRRATRPAISPRWAIPSTRVRSARWCRIRTWAICGSGRRRSKRSG